MRIRTTHHVDHPERAVREWFERPGALTRLTPPSLAGAEDPDAGGTETGRLVGVRLGPSVLPSLLRPQMISRHIASDGPGHFIDRQAKGPFRTWQHEHTITADGPDRTAITDEIVLELPRRLERFEELAADQVRGLLAFRHRQLRDDLAFHARFADTPPRTIAVAGSSGMIGSQLVALLQTGGHTVKRMIRETEVGEGEIAWHPKAGILDPADLQGVDAVINLAGSSIATRWTPRARRRIRNSRVRSAHLMARILAHMEDGPRVLVQGSAIGGYGGQRPGELLTEADPGGEGFLAEVVRDWEASARPAVQAGLRVAAVRTGIVLSDAGGSLLPQLPLFWAGAGGRLTRPDAVQSWISLDDIARVFAHAALSPQVEGPVNGVAPQPVTAREFARTLGKVMRRPSLVPVPPAGPRLLLGADAAEELVGADQNVSDAWLQATGFTAAHPDLETALRHVLRR